MTTPLTIISLDVTNFARLKAVRIEPNSSGAVVISGNNAQGKSSVLNAIMQVIDGSKYKVPVPVHVGEKAADVEIALGRDGVPELIVKWHQDSNGKKWLEVTDPIGRKKSSPAALMKSLFGYLSVNPFAFAQSSDKDQVRTLLASTGFNMDEWDSERSQIFNDRTVVNREVTRTKKVLESLREPKPDVPDEPVSAGALLDKRGYVQERREEVLRAVEGVRAWGEKVDELKAQLEEAERNLHLSIEWAKTFEGETVVGYNEQLAEIDAQLATIDVTNTEVRAKQQYIEAYRAFAGNEKQSDALTASLKEHDGKLQEAISQVDLPIKGLSFEDEKLQLNGVPFAAASHAEKLTIGTALAIAAQPQAGVILIEDGSLMDENTTQIIVGMAEKHGMQVWIESVGTEYGFVIEDGEVRA
uniref:AAA family ATPase n=1 Tax=Micrococcus phage Kurnik TaxID=3092208 RepID=A0AAU6R6C4_9CAUD